MASWLTAAVAAGILPGFETRAAETCIDLAKTVPPDRLTALARGINLAGWMDAPQSSAPDLTTLRALRNNGMTHARLPIPAERLMQRFTPQLDLNRQLLAVDQALVQLLSIGYSISLDLHPGDQFRDLHRENPIQSMEALRDAWSNLARIAKRHPPERIFAELLNEPEIDAQRWQAEAGQLAGFIRQALPQTTLIVGPVNWQRPDSLPDFRPLTDPNVVYAIHFYDPMVFTHQGHWNPEDPLSNIRALPYPIEPDSSAVKDMRRRLTAEGKQQALDELDKAIVESGKGDVVARELEYAVAWQKRFSRPLIINEFGVLKAEAPPESRVRWLHSVVGFAERHCWGWTHWELAQGFGLLDANTGEPDRDILRALLSRP